MAFDLHEASALLERTPHSLTALLAGLPEPWVRENEGGESWSPFEIVGHLVHGERTDWIPRARLILEQGEAVTFEPFDRFAQLREPDRDMAELLDEFRTLRTDNVASLRALAPTEDDLRRRGRHPELGPVTLGQLLATWVVHDLGHVRQIARTMARRWAAKTDVGPWRAYLPVLER